MKDRKQLALNFLLEKVKQNDFVYSFTTPSIVFSAEVLVKYGKYQEAFKLLEQISLKVISDGVISHKNNYEFPSYYLFVLAKYLLNSKDVKKDLESFLPAIKKIISLFEKQFCQHYLLLKSYDPQTTKKTYQFFDNMYFLLAVEKIADILNQNNAVNLADTLFLLKTKVDLGFERYLFNRTEKIYLNYFTSLYQFEVLQARKLYQVKQELPQINFYVTNSLKKDLLLTTDIEGHSCSKLLLSALTLKELKEDKKAQEIEEVLDFYLDSFPSKLLSYKRAVFEQKVRNSLGDKKEVEQNKVDWIVSKPEFLKTILTYLYYYY